MSLIAAAGVGGSALRRLRQAEEPLHVWIGNRMIDFVFRNFSLVQRIAWYKGMSERV